MKFRSGRRVTSKCSDNSNFSDETDKDKENEENHGSGIGGSNKKISAAKLTQVKKEPLAKREENRDLDIKPVINRGNVLRGGKEKDDLCLKKRDRTATVFENPPESEFQQDKKFRIKKEPNTERKGDAENGQDSVQMSESNITNGAGLRDDRDEEMDLFTAEEVTEALLHNENNSRRTTINNMMTQPLFDENEESSNDKNDNDKDDESTEIEDSERETSTNGYRERPKRKLKSKRGKKKKHSWSEVGPAEPTENKRTTRKKPCKARRRKKQKITYASRSQDQSDDDVENTTEDSTPSPTADEGDNGSRNYTDSENYGKRKRGRPCKYTEDRKHKKIKGTTPSDSEPGRSNFDPREDTNKHCTIAEPCVKLSKKANRADLEAKTKVGDEKNINVTNSHIDLHLEISTDRETLEGTLVVWEGQPNEPVFKKNAPKPGRFYIVNCGEPKSINPCKKPTEVPPQPTNSSSCTCCASGCQTFSNSNPSGAVSNPHGIVTGETSKRVSRRRPKGPKKVQLVTKEEHHKILSTYIEDKKYEPEGETMKESRGDSNLMWLLDFKVDSLFVNQVDPSQQHQQNSSHPGPINPPTENPPRRTRLQKRMAPAKQAHTNKQNTSKQQQKKNAAQAKAIEPPVTATAEEEEVVGFTVGNEELVDDVAGYEMVDSNVANEDLQKNAEENPEFGVQLSQEDGGTNEQRQKRPYRMRKVPAKEYHGEIICDQTGKPRCTYTDLIEKALIQSIGGLTVSEIYNWISSNYPYFQANDDRWKNSVRHNLSINPYFKKGDKARNGAGHLWVISEDGKGIRPPIRRKSGSDNIMDSICIENGDVIPIRNETDRAISVILSEYAMASMQHQNSNQEEESSPYTYIQLPNDIAIGGENDHSGQVICYEDLPDGSYTIDVQDSNYQSNSEQMYTLSDFAEGNVIIVNSDESNKENVDGRMLDDMVVSDFSVLSNDGGMITSGRLSAPPLDAPNYFGGPIKRDRVLNRSSSLPLNNPQSAQDIILDHSSMGLHDPSDQHELTILNSITSVNDHEAMDTINVVSAPHDTQVIEIIGDHLFDAKELGMVYEYDSQGDPLFL